MDRQLTPEDFDYDIGLSRNAIIDKFILASSVFGFLYMGVTFWRDLSLGIISANSAVNLVIACLPTSTWLIRHRVEYRFKVVVLFLTYLIGCVKSILIFGTFSNSAMIFACFCIVILSVSYNYKWTILLSLIFSLIIPLRAYLQFSGIHPIDVSAVQISSDKLGSWVQLYITFLLSGAIVIFGTGQLRIELKKYIALLQESILGLESANKQLKNEIELKNSFEENLLVSSRKFESLFENSRDGVILFNSSGKVIEVNEAICDISGYTRDEIRNADSIFQFIESPFKKTLIMRFQKQIHGELMPILTEVGIKKKNGGIAPVEINSNVILTEDEVMTISTIRDISYRKQLENEKFNAALAAEERERERFSKDLHDDLGPAFSTLNLYLQTLSKKESDPAKKEILDKLSDIVDLSVKQVREISHNLSPYLLRDAGLVKAIAMHLTKINDNDALKVEFEQRVDPDLKTPQNIEIVLYRVFLELLNNTIKHSGADRVKILLEFSSQKFCFSYIDNGKGFDQNRISENKSGIGLKNIENRVKSLGGTLRFTYKNEEMNTEIIIPA